MTENEIPFWIKALIHIPFLCLLLVIADISILVMIYGMDFFIHVKITGITELVIMIIYSMFYGLVFTAFGFAEYIIKIKSN